MIYKCAISKYSIIHIHSRIRTFLAVNSESTTVLRYQRESQKPSNEGQIMQWLFVCLVVFNATFNNISDIVPVSFIGGGNRRTRRKPPTCHKWL